MARRESASIEEQADRIVRQLGSRLGQFRVLGLEFGSFAPCLFPLRRQAVDPLFDVLLHLGRNLVTLWNDRLVVSVRRIGRFAFAFSCYRALFSGGCGRGLDCCLFGFPFGNYRTGIVLFCTWHGLTPIGLAGAY